MAETEHHCGNQGVAQGPRGLTNSDPGWLVRSIFRRKLLEVKPKGATLIFDFGEVSSEMASKLNPDGSVSFVSIVAGFDGLERSRENGVDGTTRGPTSCNKMVMNKTKLERALKAGRYLHANLRAKDGSYGSTEGTVAMASAAMALYKTTHAAEWLGEARELVRIAMSDALSPDAQKVIARHARELAAIAPIAALNVAAGN